MLVQCTQPCGPRALDASKFSAHWICLISLEKVNAHLLTCNYRLYSHCSYFEIKVRLRWQSATRLPPPVAKWERTSVWSGHLATGKYACFKKVDHEVTKSLTLSHFQFACHQSCPVDMSHPSLTVLYHDNQFISIPNETSLQYVLLRCEQTR